ncbi:FAD:protein FMN transferase [Hoeflea sp. TYP-13]|uniref:FAD:protein FMN transferase n=1 Tax=Hoeflea sp. TYP-13 TaxID=3230023 RepID=UPI0034C5D08C
MTLNLTRRRFLTLTAAAAALPGPALAAAPVAKWRGVALGAAASMTLKGIDQGEASGIFAAVEAEISRLEDIFSLYRKNSALARLNRSGALESAPAELAELLSLSDALHTMTGGAFDPTIQALWQLYARATSNGSVPSASEIEATRKRCGWEHLIRHGGSVSFARDDMALTLNGIAQGYITDKVAALLRQRGLTDIAIDMGEVVALGRGPAGESWRAGISAPDGTIVRQIPLENRALATSAPLGTVLDPSGSIGHILDPLTGKPGGHWKLVSVSAERAALADGLSTAFCLMPRIEIDAVVAANTDVSLEILV